MKLLVLGGTIFLGRHIVEAALARGYDVTLFNRGEHNADLYPQTEKLRGNRDGGLNALVGRRWDAVIDTCGYVPRIVRASAEILANSVGSYTFISSLSVYKEFSKPDADESEPLGTLEDETVEEVNGETYGPLKALCEQAAEHAMPGRVLNIRAGLIVGPHDPTDRFTYWPRRIAQGGEVLAPGNPGSPVQFIDARDLAEWNLNMIETGKTGTFNATGPDYSLTMGSFLETCVSVSGSNASLTWVAEPFLLQQGAQPWSELPLWVPCDTTEEYRGFSTTNCRKAIASGLRFRPVADTVRDTLTWHAKRPADHVMRAGLKPEREQELLNAWHTRQA
jgi:2'-hydroxyisoflavone reductase